MMDMWTIKAAMTRGGGQQDHAAVFGGGERRRCHRTLREIGGSQTQRINGTGLAVAKNGAIKVWEGGGDYSNGWRGE
jgi:hypothetical protein